MVLAFSHQKAVGGSGLVLATEGLESWTGCNLWVPHTRGELCRSLVTAIAPGESDYAFRAQMRHARGARLCGVRSQVAGAAGPIGEPLQRGEQRQQHQPGLASAGLAMPALRMRVSPPHLPLLRIMSGSVNSSESFVSLSDSADQADGGLIVTPLPRIT